MKMQVIMGNWRKFSLNEFKVSEKTGLEEIVTTLYSQALKSVITGDIKHFKAGKDEMIKQLLGRLPKPSSTLEEAIKVPGDPEHAEKVFKGAAKAKEEKGPWYTSFRFGGGSVAQDFIRDNPDYPDILKEVEQVNARKNKVLKDLKNIIHESYDVISDMVEGIGQETIPGSEKTLPSGMKVKQMRSLYLSKKEVWERQKEYRARVNSKVQILNQMNLHDHELISKYYKKYHKKYGEVDIDEATAQADMSMMARAGAGMLTAAALFLAGIVISFTVMDGTALATETITGMDQLGTFLKQLYYTGKDLLVGLGSIALIPMMAKSHFVSKTLPVAGVYAAIGARVDAEDIVEKAQEEADKVHSAAIGVLIWSPEGREVMFGDKVPDIFADKPEEEAAEGGK